MAEGWINRFDDCTFQWEEVDGGLAPVIVLVPSHMAALMQGAVLPMPEVETSATDAAQVLDAPPPLHALASEFDPESIPRQVLAEVSLVPLSEAEALELAAALLRQVQMCVQHSKQPLDARLRNRLKQVDWECQKIESTMQKRKKKPQW